MRKLLLIFVLFVAPAQAQVLKLQAGASDIFNAQGASATWFTPTTEETASVGIADGHLVAGLQSKFLFHGFKITAGDSQQFLTTDSAGLAVALRGVAAKRGHVTFFAGAVGRAYGAPFFSGTEAKNFGAGIEYNTKFYGFDSASVTAFASSRRTAIQSLSRRRGPMYFSGTGGWVENAGQLNGTVQYQTQPFSASVARSTYRFNGDTATTDSEAASATLGALNLHASAFQGRANGETFGATLRAGWLQVDGNEFFSRAGRTITGSFTQRLSRRFSVSEYYTRQGNQSAVNFGGAYTSNAVSISAAYQQMFFPFASVPFAKVLSLRFDFQLPHSTSAHVDLQATPGQAIRWTGYGASYVQTGVEIAGQASAPSKVHGVEISGFVRDKSGMPVEGAAVKVGDKIAYTDFNGKFTARFGKPGAQAVEVLLEEFTAPGNWEVVSCEAFNCVVQRR